MESSMLIHVESGSLLYDSFVYPAGETQVRLTKEGLDLVQRAVDIRVVSRIRSAQHVMTTALLLDAIRRANEGAVTTLTLPYLPYGRADRVFVPGDCHGLYTFLTIMSGFSAMRMVTLDAHSDVGLGTNAIQDISPYSLMRQTIFDFCRKTYTDNLAVLFPDEGARKRYAMEPGYIQTHSTRVGVEVFHAEKKRDPVSGKFLGFTVPEIPKGMNVLILDDLCDGGGTFLGIAEILASRGMTHRGLYVTHGIFSKGIDTLLNWFDYIYTTDSFYGKALPGTLVNERVHIYPAEPVLLKG